jgi:hypothetical protein
MNVVGPAARGTLCGGAGQQSALRPRIYGGTDFASVTSAWCRHGTKIRGGRRSRVGTSDNLQISPPLRIEYCIKSGVYVKIKSPVSILGGALSGTQGHENALESTQPCDTSGGIPEDCNALKPSTTVTICEVALCI